MPPAERRGRPLQAPPQEPPGFALSSLAKNSYSYYSQPFYSSPDARGDGGALFVPELLFDQPLGCQRHWKFSRRDQAHTAPGDGFGQLQFKQLARSRYSWAKSWVTKPIAQSPQRKLHDQIAGGQLKFRPDYTAGLDKQVVDVPAGARFFLQHGQRHLGQLRQRKGTPPAAL